MNGWLIGAIALLFGLIPCGLLIRKYTLVDSLIALEMAGTLSVLVLMVMAEGYQRPPFFDLALVLAPLSFAGGLVFVRFLESWV